MISKLKKHHSVLSVFCNINLNVPRIVVACLVYARLLTLWAICGRFLINGYTTGENIASMFGTSLGLVLVDRIISLVYNSNSEKMMESKKSSNTVNTFIATTVKFVLISLVYVYMALGIYFSFDNALYIPDSKLIAGAFIAALILDVCVVDSIYALAQSLFDKKDHSRIGEKSPNNA